MTEFVQTLKATLDELKINYTEEIIGKAADYACYLRKENEKMNLTAITEPGEMAVKHFADSLCLLNYVDLPKNASLLDVGSGAGFPGLVLRLFRPDLKVTLLDASKKRCGFLERLKRELFADDVEILWGRSEELAREENLREQFDFVTARAVASLPVLLELCTPFLKPGGRFLAMKGKEETDGAAKALTLLNCELAVHHRYRLNGEDRAVLEIKKLGPTPEKYPRRAGMPEKRPL
ncbi:MAG TPA: 16S rRNA (guanine(527)-N(7))-methyltransferase RsmG [Clostridiales bacterium]|nr:16S rRNA (guanine(527)-N(7))-methyltransferase RsmG [Clostridiales bacterium]